MTDTMNRDVPVESEKGKKRGGRKGRMRSSRASLTRMLVIVALLAVAVIGVVNVIGARQIFTDLVDSQLSSLAEDRAQTVERELARMKAEVAVIARDTYVAAAARDLVGAYVDLAGGDDALTAGQEQELIDFYATSPEVSGQGEAVSLLPPSASARYLQYYYIVNSPNQAGERRDLVDAGDGSAYSAAHAIYHPALAERARLLGVGDLMLIKLGDDPAIAYSTDKRIDFATSLEVGPYSETGLAQAIASRLAAVSPGDAILVDFERYLPAGSSPTMFAVAAIRDKTEVVGAVAVALPDGFIDSITTFDQDWASINVGASGETYLVGSDRLMRSVSRSWLEDPEAYLTTLSETGYPPEVADAVAGAGTTVLTQPADTDAVNAAFEGTNFVGDERNYLGERTTSYSTQVLIPDMDWVIVSSFGVAEANAPLWRYLMTLGILALVTIPIVAVIAIVFAGRLTRPVKPLIETATSIANGDIDASVPDLGHNEYGDLANRINALTAELRARDAQRAEQEHETSKVLLAALPSRLVDDVRDAIRDGSITDAAAVSDLSNMCTVIAVSVRGYFDLAPSDMEATIEVSTDFARAVELVASEFNIERVRSTPEDHLFTAGLHTSGIAAGDAIRFVEKVLELLDQLQEETARTGEFRIGMSGGDVATGLLRANEFAFDIWGPPVRTAMTFSRVADPYQVLIDGAVAAEAGEAWDLREVEVVDLQGNRLTAFVRHDPTPESS